jgi:hypothetical protein
MRSPSISTSDTAEIVFSILISGAYRRNSLARMDLAECRAAILPALHRCMKRGSPIELTVLAFPFKVPNPAKVGTRRLPDFAELSAIRHLCALRDTIRIAYPPGMELHILHDGSLIADVFGIDPQEVRRYEKYFAELVAKAQASDFIRCYDFGELQRRNALDPSGATEELQSTAQQWWRQSRGTAEWRFRFQKTLGMINLREFSAPFVAHLMEYAGTGQLPPGREGWELERRVHHAMVQYHVQDAIIHQFDPRPCCFPDAIHASTQDRRGRLSIWMVRRGQSLLPWHGVGCLDDRGRAHVVHAADISDRPNYRSAFIAGEKTPFMYRKLTASAPLGFAASHMTAIEQMQGQFCS